MQKILSLFLVSTFIACASFQKAEISKVASKKVAYAESISFIAGEELQFPDFKMTYVKEVDPEEGAEIQSTASIRNRYFNIVENTGEKTEIVITHGQLPPNPFKLKLKSGQYVINTFKSSKGESLFDTKIEVVKK